MAWVGWLTDLHLNLLGSEQRQAFYRRLAGISCEAYLLTGDLGEAGGLCELLCEWDDVLRRPLYFVLGNHDFYRGSIETVRHDVAALCRERPRLCYLTQESGRPLTEETFLVGHDGWGDARLGDYEHCESTFHDVARIAELEPFRRPAPERVDKETLRPLLQAWGDAAAQHLARVLPMALETFPRAIVLTHVPPFREACWYDGKLVNDKRLPLYTCHAVGEVLKHTMQTRPERELLVLCGHTHGRGQAQILPNLTVFSGGADYGRPALQQVLRVK